MNKPHPLLNKKWRSTIPKYNVRYIQTLENEHEYFFRQGKVLKKGTKISQAFPITYTPDNFYHPNAISEKDAKEKALEYIRSLQTQGNIYVYEWGTNHKNPNKVNAVIVKMRYLAPISFHEEKELYSSWRTSDAYGLRNAYPESVRKFAKKKLSELKKLRSEKESFWKYMNKKVNNYFEFEINHPFKR